LQAAFLLPDFVIPCPTSSFPPEQLGGLAGVFILIFPTNNFQNIPFAPLLFSLMLLIFKPENKNHLKNMPDYLTFALLQPKDEILFAKPQQQWQSGTMPHKWNDLKSITTSCY